MDTQKPKLVSFNAIPKEWEQFQKLAKRDGRPASYYLNQFIKQSIKNGSVSDIDNDINLPDNLATTDDIRSAIAPLLNRIDLLEDELKKELPLMQNGKH